MKSSRSLFSTLKLLLGPNMAFALSFPTVGYYTFGTYSSLAGVEGSAPTIAYRGFALVVLLAAYLSSRRNWASLPRRFLPGIVFLIIYFSRMLENVMIEGVEIPPANGKVFLSYFGGAVFPSLMLASMWRSYSPRGIRVVFSVMAAAFSIGAILLIGRLEMSLEDSRLSFEKVNPISLAYVGSSFILYYLLVAQTSIRAAIEAAVVVPGLLFIALSAQSRGMILSTAAVILLYFLLLRGGRKLMMFSVMSLLAVVAVVFVDPGVFERALLSVSRIDAEKDMSTAMRVLSFRGAIEQFWADPLFGRWINEQYTGYYPHNIYLESLMAVGLIGSVPFAVHLFYSFVAAFYILRLRGASWVWTLFALLFFREAIGGAFSGSLWGNAAFWITSFMVIAIWRGHKSEVRRARSVRFASNGFSG